MILLFSLILFVTFVSTGSVGQFAPNVRSKHKTTKVIRKTFIVRILISTAHIEVSRTIQVIMGILFFFLSIEQLRFDRFLIIERDYLVS